MPVTFMKHLLKLWELFRI